MSDFAPLSMRSTCNQTRKCRVGPILQDFLQPYYLNVCNKLVFCTGRPFQPSLIFVSKAGAYPSVALLRCSTLGQAHVLTLNHQTRQWTNTFAYHKHSLITGEKHFKTTGLDQIGLFKKALKFGREMDCQIAHVNKPKIHFSAKLI